MIYIVACGRNKINHSARASELYTGSYFKACLAYAYAMEGDAIYIISAKYGLIELDEIVTPYDLLISDKGSVSKEYVKQQAKQLRIINKEVTILGGKKYINFLRKVWPTAQCPLKGGLLSQISWLNKQADAAKMKKQMLLWR